MTSAHLDVLVRGLRVTLHQTDTGPPALPHNYTPTQAVATTTAGSMSAKEKSRIDADGNQDQAGLTSRTSSSSHAHMTGDSNQDKKEVDGGSFDMLNDPYILPADDDEWSRLRNKQHEALYRALGGLYPSPDVVQAILTPLEGETRHILDLGSGSGAWAVDMAKEFPHAQVIGIDLLPTPLDKGAIPSNCKFEIEDINHGLSRHRDKYDLIHCRLVTSGLANFRKSKEDIEKCLKPGGLILWLEVDYHMMARNMTDYSRFPSDRNPNGSWIARMLFELAQAAIYSGRTDLLTMRKILDRGLWDDPILNPKTCHCASLYLPTAPWIEDGDARQQRRLKYIGAVMRKDTSKGIKDSAPLLKRVGYKDDAIKRFFANMDDELDHMKQPTWVRMILAWGRRRGSGQDDAPPLRARAQASEDSNKIPPYPFLVVYDTPEKARVDANLRDGRRESIPLPPLPPGLQ